VDGGVDAASLSAFVASYQAIKPLTLGELWAVPIMLRLGLIENLRRVAVRLSAGVRDRGRVKFLIPGGASSQWLSGSDEHLDAPLDMDYVQQTFGVMLGSGAVMVFDQTTDPILVAWRLAKFFAHESCGKCTPCREGTGGSSGALPDVHGGTRRFDLLLGCNNLAPA
jgi:NADH:ubiquinone oxidoreductase subunit F (NADH-binding)